MHEHVAALRAEIEALCRRLSVRRLVLLCSAVGRTFTGWSDVDMLVEFDPLTGTWSSGPGRTCMRGDPRAYLSPIPAA